MQHRQKHKITYTHFETICARKTPPKKFDPFPIRSRLKTTITTRKISSSKSIEDDDHDKQNHDDEKNLMTRKNSCKRMKDLRRLLRKSATGGTKTSATLHGNHFLEKNERHAAWERSWLEGPGGSWGPLGPSWGGLGGLLAALGGVLGASWALLGPPWNDTQKSLKHRCSK